MPTIADGECFASKIPHGPMSATVSDVYAVVFKDGSKGWATYDYSRASDLLKCVRISWRSDGTLMPGDQTFTDVAKLAAERDQLMSRAEAAEAEMKTLQEESAKNHERAMAWMRHAFKTAHLYQPVIDAAVAWESQFGDGERAMQRLFEAVRAFKAARPKGFCNKDRLSRIDILTMKTESEAPEAPFYAEQETPVERSFAEAVDLLDGAHQPKSDKSCATCRHMDGEMCELSGARAEDCLETAFSNWCPIDEVRSRVEGSLRSLGIIEDIEAVDGMGPNGPVLHEKSNLHTDKVDPVEKMLARAAELQKSCLTCRHLAAPEATPPCRSCRTGVWDNWLPRE